MKLLIIEDEASLQELMTATLKKEGYVVENAMDYNEAMDKLGAYNYDCVLLDLNLPGGNGLDILEHVKKYCNKLNVIIISARDSIDDKVRGLELVADDLQIGCWLDLNSCLLEFYLKTQHDTDHHHTHCNDLIPIRRLHPHNIPCLQHILRNPHKRLEVCYMTCHHHNHYYNLMCCQYNLC